MSYIYSKLLESQTKSSDDEDDSGNSSLDVDSITIAEVFANVHVIEEIEQENGTANQEIIILDSNDDDKPVEITQQQATIQRPLISVKKPSQLYDLEKLQRMKSPQPSSSTSKEVLLTITPQEESQTPKHRYIIGKGDVGRGEPIIRVLSENVDHLNREKTTNKPRYKIGKGDIGRGEPIVRIRSDEIVSMAKNESRQVSKPWFKVGTIRGEPISRVPTEHQMDINTTLTDDIALLKEAMTPKPRYKIGKGDVGRGEPIIRCTSPENHEANLEETLVTISKCFSNTIHKDCHVCGYTRYIKFICFTNQTGRRLICDETCLNQFKQLFEVPLKSKRVRALMELTKAAEGLPPPASKCCSCARDIKGLDYVITWEVKHFCGKICLSEFMAKLGRVCAFCKVVVKNRGKYCVRFGNEIVQFCTNVCLDKYKKSVKICCYCQKNITEKISAICQNLQATRQDFCSFTCIEKYDIVINRHKPKIPLGKLCAVCKFANKPIDIVLEIYDQKIYMCSEKCLLTYDFQMKTPSAKCQMCNFFTSKALISSNTIFYDGRQVGCCSTGCLNIYLVTHRVIIQCKCCQVKKYNFDIIRVYNKDTLVYNVCSLECLGCLEALQFQQKPKEVVVSPAPVVVPQTQITTPPSQPTSATPLPILLKRHIIIKKAPEAPKRNVATLCKVKQFDVGTNTFGSFKNQHSQTNNPSYSIIPIPVPIYVPCPMAMFSVPVPIPVPFPIPIPIPVFIPTTKKTTAGIAKYFDKIKKTVPDDPFEAELLAMADCLAGDEKKKEISSEDEEDLEPKENFSIEHNSPKIEEAPHVEDDISIPLGEDDIVDTLFRLVTETGISEDLPDIKECDDILIPMTSTKDEGIVFKKRKMSKTDEIISKKTKIAPKPPQVEQNDDKTKLQYIYGVNAWRDFFSKSCPTRKCNLLDLSTSELNEKLCAFVEGVRKPNGVRYAPDTLYYLCLGIQLYLVENNRQENIFCDYNFAQFTTLFNTFALKYMDLYSGAKFIVTRVEEEYLWESKQLGVHSPQVLLSTLLYFNTKYFFLPTVEKHLQLTFCSIVRHAKRVRHLTQTKKVTLCYYPPLEQGDTTGKRKVLEQPENLENSMRCPVKLFQFYLTKCPEAVKGSSGVYYLTPERSCCPESPVWFSTEPLSNEVLELKLNRIKMVKEINVALLSNN